MKFYDILQLDPQGIKNSIKDSSDKKEKLKFKIGMFVRSLLLVLFSVLFITVLTALFGSENSPMAVVFFCIMLAVRFVDFGYCIKDELLNLAVVFLILLIAPVVACYLNPLLGFFINLVAFFAILLITCDDPKMGNGGLYGFAYIYLCGNTVFGEALINRLQLTLLCLVICGVIFYVKHKDKNQEIRFKDKLREINLSDFKYQWMIRMAVGVSVILLVGIAFNIERFMWIGFAASSLLSVYSEFPSIKKRFAERFIGVIVGVVIFFAIYNIIPADFHYIIGPLGGFCLGFCVEYRHKTAMNCLGALLIASQIYGLRYSLLMRISNTIIGLIFAFLFLYICERYVFAKLNQKIFDKKTILE